VIRINPDSGIRQKCMAGIPSTRPKVRRLDPLGAVADVVEKRGGVISELSNDS
jgi:hypothetical protein